MLPVSSTIPAVTTIPDEDRGFLGVWLADGPALLSVSAVALIASGAFAWFLAVTRQLLPHDLAWLSIDEADLRAIAGGRIVDFMAHDRAAFGGTLIAIGILYLWLIRFPLRAGQAWAWWTLVVSGGLGFLSFLSYLGTGYLDTWHGVASLALLPPFVLGLAASRRLLVRPTGIGVLRLREDRTPRRSPAGAGWLLLLLTGFGMLAAGLTIVTIGSVVVFVPQDLEFIGLSRATLDAIDPHLVPLIAHDRAGFGGGLLSAGAAILPTVFCARPSRSLWEALLLSGAAGFGAALGVHGLIGYLNIVHTGPAVLGAAIFASGLALTMTWRRPVEAAANAASVREAASA